MKATQLRSAMAGGRGALILGRAALWGLVGLMLLRGFVSLVRPEPDVGELIRAHLAQSMAFPHAAAEALAVRFATDYLTWDQADPEGRAARLRAYSGSEAIPVQAGWHGQGRQEVVQAVAGETRQRTPDAALVLVDVLVRPWETHAAEELAPGAPRWLRLGVPVALTTDGAPTVAALPSLLAADTLGAAPRLTALPTSPEAVAGLGELAELFFRAYAAGNPAETERYLVAGSRLPTLGGVVRFVGLRSVGADPAGDRRRVQVVVTWQSGTGQFDQPYLLGVTRQGGRWFITDVTAPGPGADGAAIGP